MASPKFYTSTALPPSGSRDANGIYLLRTPTGFKAHVVDLTGNFVAQEVDWANVTNKPTTLSGYGITDAAPASGSNNYITNDATLQWSSRNKMFPNSYFALSGQANGDMGMTGLYDRNELTNASLRGTVTLAYTGTAGTATTNGINTWFNAQGDYGVISGTDATTTKIEILVDLGSIQGNYSAALWQPFFAYRINPAGNTFTYYKKITCEVSYDGTAWYAPASGWQTTDFVAAQFPFGHWMGSNAYPTGLPNSSYRYVRFTLEDRVQGNTYNDVWISEIGLRHYSAPYARQYVKTAGDDIWGPLFFHNRLNGAGNFAMFNTATGALIERTPSQVIIDLGLGGVGNWNSAYSDGLVYKSNIGSGVDLNTYTTTGIYLQPANSNATGVLNYPTAAAGILEVASTLYSGTPYVFQRYTTYLAGNPAGHGVYFRTKYNSTWTNWTRVWASNDFAQSDVTGWASLFGQLRSYQNDWQYAPVNGQPRFLWGSINSPVPTLNVMGVSIPSLATGYSSNISLRNGAFWFQTQEAGVWGNWLQIADRAWVMSQGFIPASDKGATNGVCPLDSDAKVPAAYLPSYVDDVLEFVNYDAFPVAGESGKIYVDSETGRSYRWSGSIYTEIIASPGTTDNVTEGAINKYFTDQRAIDACEGSFAPDSHTHGIDEITGLSTALAGKQRLMYAYSPANSADVNGEVNDITYDSDFIYFKLVDGWRRVAAESW